jgi:RNA polymerase sigma-70 factor (ECF subfamily)
VPGEVIARRQPTRIVDALGELCAALDAAGVAGRPDVLAMSRLQLTRPPQRPHGTRDHDEVTTLVTRAQAGSADAFGELYDLYVDTVYRYVHFRAGSTALTEDLVSETFLRALRRISTFEWQGHDFAAWLITIARNLIADHYKSSRYRLELPTDRIVETGAAAPDASTAVLESETNRSLIDAVKTLPADQQECVVLRFLQGMSVAETALVLGKKDGAVKSLQYRALRALERKLRQGGAL